MIYRPRVGYWKSYLLINRLFFSKENLIDAGVGLEKAAQMLGHKNLNTTRIYTTPSQADLQEAAERIAWED